MVRRRVWVRMEAELHLYPDLHAPSYHLLPSVPHTPHAVSLHNPNPTVARHTLSHSTPQTLPPPIIHVGASFAARCRNVDALVHRQRLPAEAHARGGGGNARLRG